MFGTMEFSQYFPAKYSTGEDQKKSYHCAAPGTGPLALGHMLKAVNHPANSSGLQ